MKFLKKSFAFALVAMMTLALTTLSVFAAGSNTITVKGGYAGQTYELYKIFDATVNDARQAATDADENTSVTTEGINYTLPSGKSLSTEYTYTDSNGTSHTVKGTDWFTVDAAGNIKAKSGADVSTEAFREWAKKFGTKVDTKTVGDSNANVTFTGLDDGYYFITTTTGSLVTVDSVAPNAIVKDKNEVPSIDKVVSGGTKTGSEDAATNQEANTASIGDVLTYKTTVHAKKNAKKYVLTDTMENGLSLQNYEGDTKLLVQVNGTSLRLGTDYTIDTFTTGKGGTFVVTFKQSYLDSLTADVDIDVTYKVLVNEDAEIASANVNTATLKYGDNQTVVKDETSTYAYKFGLYKTAKIDGVEHTVLDGAKFKLYDAKTGGNEIPVVYDNGVYRPALTGETGVEIEVGTATISGLKNDTYYLVETEAPEGYNKLTERQEVKVKDANNVGSVVENVYQQDGGLEVVNKAGAVLPSTGGMGTTLIYIVGAMLIAFSGILLLNRRHMNDE